MREPSVAGQFYDGSKDGLMSQVKDCFLSEYGPKELPGKQKTGKDSKQVIGAISPHAGFMFSGPAAAFVYKKIAETEKPDLFIIIGPNHTGTGRTSFMLDDFKTPLGTAKVDREFGKLLSEKLTGKDALVEDSRAHLYEHSIEVQLPFLQFIYSEAKDDFSFFPIVISSEINLDRVAALLKAAVDEYEKKGKRVSIIASSDFTHYGTNYGYMPFEADENVKENLKKLDIGAIELIQKLDYKGFMEYVKKTGATICGFLPIYVMLKALEGRAERAELLTYYTSADIIRDYSNSVSYAGIIIQ